MLREPRCHARSCKHFLGTKGENAEERPVCAAFPDGIPVEIGYGDNLHLTPVSGDHGIVYERGEMGGEASA